MPDRIGNDPSLWCPPCAAGNCPERCEGCHHICDLEALVDHFGTAINRDREGGRDMNDDHQSAMELAGRIDADVLALRDAVGLGAAGVDCPQDVWQILVSLMDVPGRIVNVVETLDRYLRRAIEDFAADNNADPAVRVVNAVDELAVAVAHLTDAAAPLHRAAQAVSGLRLTPAAAEVLSAVDDGEAAD